MKLQNGHIEVQVEKIDPWAPWDNRATTPRVASGLVREVAEDVKACAQLERIIFYYQGNALTREVDGEERRIIRESLVLATL